MTSNSRETTPNFDKFVKRLMDLRPRIEKRVAPIVGEEEAEDIVSEVYLRISDRARAEELGDGLIFRTAFNIAIDTYRRNRRMVLSDDPGAFSPPGSDDRDEIAKLLGCPDFDSGEVFDGLSALEEKVLLSRTALGKTHEEAASDFGRSPEAIRKIYQRAKEKVQPRILECLLLRKDFAFLNIPRITVAQAERAAQLCHEHPQSINSLFEVFDYKEFSRAIQNATWILASLYKPGSPECAKVEDFLADKLSNGDLYRGNKNYVAEALLDLNYRRHIYRIRRDFLLRLHELEDRVTRRNAKREEKAEIRRPCLFEVKSIRPIGKEVRTGDVQKMLDAFTSGMGSVDYRRCLTFQLLRIHPWNDELAREVVFWLPLELDQINALYVIKYLRLIGFRQHPKLFSKDLSQVIYQVSRRWPGNSYIADTARLFAQPGGKYLPQFPQA